jgi:tRNA-Thr(GGU) m(6)t(6)A37 methyltransferase TsaA
VSDASPPQPSRLTLEPIGFVRTAISAKDEAARQPRAGTDVDGRIELLPGRNFEHALEDLAGWDYVWVLFWFHHNRGWRPKVLPPRSRSGRKGVFATRSPHRPNPLGMSAVRLQRIEGLTLHVAELDILDGTPVLDIKPYVAYTDSLPHARDGWLADDSAPRDPIAPFDVEWSPAAAEQAAWIEEHTQLALRARVSATLELGVEPHAYRRIRRNGDDYVLAVQEWRVRFDADGRRVRVREVVSGFRDPPLRDARPEIGVHREFRARYRGE